MEYKQLSKGKRLGWVSLKDAKKAQVSVGSINGKKVVPPTEIESSKLNVYLIPWISISRAMNLNLFNNGSAQMKVLIFLPGFISFIRL